MLLLIFCPHFETKYTGAYSVSYYYIMKLMGGGGCHPPVATTMDIL
jgi:hypothetical protein